MVEMYPHRDTERGFLITEKDQARFRPDAGVIVASGDPHLRPGDHVLVKPDRGIAFYGFDMPTFRADTTRGEVRFYGTITKSYWNPIFDGTKGIMATFSEGKIQAKGRWVLVKRDTPAEQIGSILIPDVAQTKTCRGTIVSVGDLVQDVKVGDYVTYNGRGICNVTFDEGDLFGLEGTPDDYTFVPEAELLAIYEI